MSSLTGFCACAISIYIDTRAPAPDLSSMSVRITFVSAQPFIIGIGVPIAVLKAGLVLPIVYTQGRDIQKILDGLDVIKSDVSDLKKNVDAIDKRERQAETDPDKLVAKVLGVSADFVSIGSVSIIDDKVVVFPKTSSDMKRLVDTGYSLKPITPTISGYTAP